MECRDVGSNGNESVSVSDKGNGRNLDIKLPMAGQSKHGLITSPADQRSTTRNTNGNRHGAPGPEANTISHHPREKGDPKSSIFQQSASSTRWPSRTDALPIAGFPFTFLHIESGPTTTVGIVKQTFLWEYEPPSNKQKRSPPGIPTASGINPLYPRSSARIS